MKTKRRKTTKTVCDNCGQIFDIGKKIVKVKKFGELEAEYFICPHCKWIFLVSVTDNALRLSIKLAEGINDNMRMRSEWLKAKYGDEIIGKIKGAAL